MYGPLYRHFDTLLGLRAREEVFPHILAWCREVDDAIDQDGEDEKEADAIAQRVRREEKEKEAGPEGERGQR